MHRYLKSKEWHDKRALGIGGSDVTILASGNPDSIHDLWLLKTGRKEPGLEMNLPILFGIVTEEANREWFSKVSKRDVWGDGDERVHHKHKWMRASLDGITRSADHREALLECKTVNAFSKMPSVISKYTPQCHHGMAVGGWSVAVLSVFIGTLRYEYAEIEFDPWTWEEIFELEKEFWACVESDREPGPDIMRGVSL